MPEPAGPARYQFGRFESLPEERRLPDDEGPVVSLGNRALTSSNAMAEVSAFLDVPR